MVPPRPCPGPRVCPRRRATGRSRLRLRCGMPRASIQPSGQGCPSGLHRAGGRRGRTPRRVHGRPPHGWSAHGARTTPPHGPRHRRPPACPCAAPRALAPPRSARSPRGPSRRAGLVVPARAGGGACRARDLCCATRPRSRGWPSRAVGPCWAAPGLARRRAGPWHGLRGEGPAQGPTRQRGHRPAGAPAPGLAPQAGGPRPGEAGTGDVADAAKAGRHLCAP